MTDGAWQAAKDIWQPTRELVHVVYGRLMYTVTVS